MEPTLPTRDCTLRRPVSGAIRWVYANLGRVLACVMLGVAAVALTGLAPEPDPVPRRWELQFEPGPLRIASVDVPNVGPRTFFYFSYRVVNNSGQDLLFAPTFELANGDGEILRSGRDVPQYVTNELLRSYQNPLMQDQIQVIGELLQGEENSKWGIAIWPVTDMHPETLAMYAAGFSGETKTVVSPDGKEKFVLRKTAMLEYFVPGDLTSHGPKDFSMIRRNWIMR